MIAALAERLGLDHDVLVDAIVASLEDRDRPQIGFSVQSVEINDGIMVERRNTGYGVIVAAGPTQAFEMIRHKDSEYRPAGSDTSATLVTGVAIRIAA